MAAYLHFNNRGKRTGIPLQTTLKSTATFDGIGLHTGASVMLRVAPAPVGHGIRFFRADIGGAAGIIPALYDRVVTSPLCTRIENDAGVSVSTIEHLMAALSGCGIHNALVTLDGPEVPIMDGSALEFVRGIVAVGIRVQNAPIEAIRVLKTVEVRDGQSLARLDPSEVLSIDFDIDFDDAAIGRQRRSMKLSNGAFVRELADSRTFCRQSDVDKMLANGLARGGTLENAVVVDGERVLSPGGLRHADEAVRHKMLDALGDLATAGAPILGRYTGVRSGHAMTNRLVTALLADPSNFARVTCSPATAAVLPGASLRASDLASLAA